MTSVSRQGVRRPHAAAARDLSSTLDALLVVGMAATRADAAGAYLTDPDEGDLRLTAARGSPGAAMGHRLASGEGLAGRVYAERRSLVSADVLVDPRALHRRADWDSEPPVRSFLGVPLRAGPVTLGVLEFTSRRPDAFDPLQRGHAAVLGDAGALLIEQTRLQAEPPRAALRGEPLTGDDPVALATLDGALRLQAANPAFTALVGQPVEALLGRPVMAVLPELGRPRARDALEGALHGASAHIGRIAATTQGGAQVVIGLSVIALGDAAEGPRGVLLAATDVSERARLETELRQQHARALEARDRLRAVVEVVSHELRTPLTSVLGYARLLHDRNDAEPERRAHWAAHVIDKARMMARLVDEVTTLARLGSAPMRLERRATDMGALTRQAAVEAEAGSDLHRFEVDVDPALEPVLVDRDRVGQVLANLMDNAVKYWPQGGSIRVTVAAEPGGVRVDVEDRGPGIPPELAEQVFEPFFRARTPATRDIPGTGLGLAVSRGIVEAHGGRLWHEAPPEGGARFRLFLPAGGGD